MRRFATHAALVAATGLAMALAAPTAPASAAENTATKGIATNEFDTAQIHVTANCVKADNTVLLQHGGRPLDPRGHDGLPVRLLRQAEHHDPVDEPVGLHGRRLRRGEHAHVQVDQ